MRIAAHPGYCGQGLLLKGAVGKWALVVCALHLSLLLFLPRLHQRETVLRIVGKLFAVLTAIVLALIAYGIYLEWNVKRWDARIDALCAANGGRDVATRVYATATAPDNDNYFHANRSLKLFRVPPAASEPPTRSVSPYVMETHVLEVLNQRDPHVVKYVQKIVRAEDKKVLGERVRYMRSGGGVPLPDPSTPHDCPTGELTEGLAIGVFLNHPRRVEAGQK